MRSRTIAGVTTLIMNEDEKRWLYCYVQNFYGPVPEKLEQESFRRKLWIALGGVDALFHEDDIPF